MAVYTLRDPAVIHYDPRRTTGHYYATVSVNVFDNSGRKNLNPELEDVKDLEVILNGPGVNKARRKIEAELRFRRIPIHIGNKDIKPLKIASNRV